MKRVGLSKAFHDEFNINYVFHVIEKNSNHDHHSYMSSKQREWWKQNMINVAIEMLDAEGNIALICNNGRSRSPMYLVAYLVIVDGLLPIDAMSRVRDILFVQRNEKLDRFECLQPIVEEIFEFLGMSLL